MYRLSEFFRLLDVLPRSPSLSAQSRALRFPSVLRAATLQSGPCRPSPSRAVTRRSVSLHVALWDTGRRRTSSEEGAGAVPPARAAETCFNPTGLHARTMSRNAPRPKEFFAAATKPSTAPRAPETDELSAQRTNRAADRTLTAPCTAVFCITATRSGEAGATRPGGRLSPGSTCGRLDGHLTESFCFHCI